MTIEHVKVLPGDSWSAIAGRICPISATSVQRTRFRAALATASQKKLTDTIHPGEILHYDTADVPVAETPRRQPKPIPFAANSPFNTPIPATARWSYVPILNTMGDTAAGDADELAGWARHLYGGDGQLYVTHGVLDDPLWTITMPEFGNDDPRFNRHWPAGEWKLRCPAAGPRVGGNEDAVVSILDEVTGAYVEIGNGPAYTINVAAKTIVGAPDAPGAPGAWHAHGNVDTGLGVGKTIASGGNSAGVRAANFSWMAGAITGYDVEQVLAGRKTDFGHALCVMLTTATMSTWGWVFPATAPNNGSNHGPIDNGARLGVPADVTAPPEMDTDPLNLALWNTLKKYGMFVGDFTGGPWPIIQFDSGSLSPETLLELQSMWVWWDHPNCAAVHAMRSMRVMVP